MAIVRILQSSKVFPAIAYNDKRVKRGEAELNKTANFGEVASLIGFEEYLKLWGNKNKRIKNKQFHAMISIAKKEITKEQLISLGEKWLEGMGYGENPYLIYFHHNTAHSHIHMITSRLDKNSHKISDKFENERAVKLLHRLEMRPQLPIYRNTISYLLRYSFTTLHQFIELCSKNGFQVTLKEDGLICRKGGERLFISRRLIEFCSERYKKQIGEKYKQKLQKLIYTYATKLSKERFHEFMKQKFGLEFIFYGKQNDINGYTIIDYKNKSVYKGSEVFSAKKITEFFDLSKNNSNYDFIIQDILDNYQNCDYDEFKNILKKLYYFEVTGNVVQDFVTKKTFELNKDVIKRLEYNRTVKLWAENFKPYNAELVKVVANIVGVKPSDMRKICNYETPDSDTLNHFNYLLTEGLKSNMKLRDFLNSVHVCLIVSNDKYYLIDYISRLSISSDDLNINIKAIKDKISSNNYSNQQNQNLVEEHYNTIPPFLDISMPNISGLFYIGSVSGTVNTKKRKKLGY